MRWDNPKSMCTSSSPLVRRNTCSIYCVCIPPAPLLLPFVSNTGFAERVALFLSFSLFFLSFLPPTSFVLHISLDFLLLGPPLFFLQRGPGLCVFWVNVCGGVNGVQLDVTGEQRGKRGNREAEGERMKGEGKTGWGGSRPREGLRVVEVKTDKLRWRIICGGPLQWGVRPRWSPPIQPLTL